MRAWITSNSRREKKRGRIPGEIGATGQVGRGRQVRGGWRPPTGSASSASSPWPASPIAGAHLGRNTGRLRDGVVADTATHVYFITTYLWDFTLVMALAPHAHRFVATRDKATLPRARGGYRPHGRAVKRR